MDLTAPPPSSDQPVQELEIDLGDETEGASLKPLIDILDDTDRRDEVAEELISVCESIRSTEQEEKRGQAALKAARDANTKLLEMDIATADPTTYAAITAQLNSVINRATKMKKKSQTRVQSRKPPRPKRSEPWLMR